MKKGKIIIEFETTDRFYDDEISILISDIEDRNSDSYNDTAKFQAQLNIQRNIERIMDSNAVDLKYSVALDK